MLRKSIASLSAMACLAWVSAPATAQTVLRFANFIPQNVAYSSVFDRFAEAVNRDAKGAIRIQVFHGGILGSNSGQQLKLVEDGVAHISNFTPNYLAGRFPETEVTDIPFLVRSAREGGLALEALQREGRLSSLAAFKILGIATTYPLSLHTAKPVNVPGDLRGVRLRVSGSIVNRTVELLGAAPVPIAGGETGESLARGVVSGVVGEPLFIVSYKMQEIAKHHLMVSLGATALMVGMRHDVYDALPPLAREAIDRNSGVAFAEMWAEHLDKTNRQAIERFRQAPGNVVVELDADAEKVWKNLLAPVGAEWVRRRPGNGELFQAFEAAVAKVRARTN
jgi:TRAP-type C4-dicarboxylate transport system substrate-binding protein